MGLFVEEETGYEEITQRLIVRALQVKVEKYGKDFVKMWINFLHKTQMKCQGNCRSKSRITKLTQVFFQVIFPDVLFTGFSCRTDCRTGIFWNWNKLEYWIFDWKNGDRGNRAGYQK